MPKIWEGKSSGRGMRFAVVMSRFNSTVTDKLLEGAVAALRRCSVADEDVEIVRVPGAFEIPIAAKKAAATGRFAAVVCLGAIIRGGTPHWDYLSRAVTEGIVKGSLDADVPMTNGVLTTESLSEAVERAGKGTDNKGYDAAVAAVEMASLVRQLGE
ncbi:MAG TPA: 6,7-dimethyl-8-ribityllumazine synthase [Vicinamibacteria bacterium]|nr:6,7-dimethyl-8-ribityllumazine synthase [Vicinamibacteria bacterium]